MTKDEIIAEVSRLQLYTAGIADKVRDAGNDPYKWFDIGILVGAMVEQAMKVSYCVLDFSIHEFNPLFNDKGEQPNDVSK